MAVSVSQFRDSIPQYPLLVITNSIHSKSTLLQKDSVIIIVCGAQSDKDNPTCRDLFIEYGKKHLTQFKLFQAEQVFSALKDLEGKDLLSLEGEFSKFSDCIIVFLESPGALAEIGAFAMEKDLVKILLTINEKKFKDSKSFIKLGPIAKADKLSSFKPTLYADFKHILKYVGLIEDRLNSKLKRRRRKRIDLSTYERFVDKKRKIKMLFISDIIALFSPLSHRDLFYILREIYGEKTRYSLKIEIGILEALGIIQRDKNLLYRTVNEKDYFFDFNVDIERLRATVLNHYAKYFRDKSPVLLRRSLQ